MPAPCTHNAPHHPGTTLQAEVLRREVGRLAGENARLHQDLLREADARAAQGATAAEAARAAEAAAADAALARQQAMERAAVLEHERDGLRAKLRDLLAFGAHHAGGGRALGVRAVELGGRMGAWWAVGVDDEADGGKMSHRLYPWLPAHPLTVWPGLPPLPACTSRQQSAGYAGPALPLSHCLANRCMPIIHRAMCMYILSLRFHPITRPPKQMS